MGIAEGAPSETRSSPSHEGGAPSTVRISGSLARGEADECGYMEVLVDLEPGRSPFDLGGLLVDLEELLGRPVAVVTEKGFRPRLRERALKEWVPI
jgi:uncharacterized protein